MSGEQDDQAEALGAERSTEAFGVAGGDRLWRLILEAFARAAS